MQAHDSAPAVHHLREISKVACRILEAVRRKRVADEDHRRHRVAHGFVLRPFVNEVRPKAGNVFRPLKGILQEGGRRRQPRASPGGCLLGPTTTRIRVLSAA